MEYRIETAKGFRLAGVKKTVTTKDGENFKLIPKFWDEVYADGTCIKIQELAEQGEKNFYGVCYNGGDDQFDYMIAVKSEKELPEGFVELIIPDCQWGKFACRGRLPESQQKVWKRVYSEWFPTSGYEHAGGPEIEWYSTENMGSDSYYSEIWLPVRKCK